MRDDYRDSTEFARGLLIGLTVSAILWATTMLILIVTL